jgi:hypothetical protein
MPTPKIEIYAPKQSDDIEKRYKDLYNAYIELVNYIQWILGHLDSKNVKEIDFNVTKYKNLEAINIITQTLVTQTLYAEKGYIAELTVDQLDTSAKVQNYLDEDTSDVNYIKIYEQHIEFRTAKVKLEEDGVTPLEPVQAVDRFDKLLYWVDNTYKAVTYTANDMPVMVYQYDETIKMKISFIDVGGTKEPFIVLGEGIGNPTYPDRGKAFIHKDTEGLLLKYIRSDGEEVYLKLGENGTSLSHDVLSALNFYSNGFIAEYGETQVGYRWTKDVQGRITQLENIYTSEVVPVTWNGGVI